jgi:hypothetical protein
MDLTKFTSDNLFEAGKSFFEQLGVPLKTKTEQSIPAKGILKDEFKNVPIYNSIKETFYLGLIDNSIFENEGLSLDESLNKVDERYDGIMVFAVKLENYYPNRTDIANLVRAFNKSSKKVPVIVLLSYQDNGNSYLTFSTSERTKYIQNWREGEKLGKVSMLKDINIEHPHTGHLKILQDLKLKSDVRTFEALYKQWQEVFDIQLLNKRFYQEIANWYFWAMTHVEFPKDACADKEVRNATNLIRLLTRLIFVWFLKEKHLVPDELFDKKFLDTVLDYKDKTGSTYYKAILQNLFFATLNTVMNKDIEGSRSFLPTETYQGKNKAHGVNLYFRYKRFMKNDSKVFQLFENIPFLNGGLFECLDSEDRTIKIDCFSDNSENESLLKVPDYLFFGEQQYVDLSDYFDDRAYKNAPVQGLMNILKSYKFTIAENTPIEEEIALDPELLGKVFENLLANYNPETQTTARKQTGSFYTPREIVNFMVDESLLHYFDSYIECNKLNIEFKTKIRTLLSYTDNHLEFNENEIETLINAIDNIKIFDPACGSGAFPMGVLHKLVYILAKLDFDNKRWKDKQIDKVNKAINSAKEIQDNYIRETVIADLERNISLIDEAFNNNSNELDYGRKLYLIENCIYGSDIQPIAVQISKLRFFISLIVDQKVNDTKFNRGILSLPNLETKFVAANTIKTVIKPDVSLFRQKIDSKENELVEIRKKYFSANTKKKKEDLRKKDHSIRTEIKKLYEIAGMNNVDASQLAFWDPYDQNSHADFFDSEWMFGITDGFDIVIGNPPYIKEYTNRKAFDGLRSSPYYQGKMDIWYLFACHGFDWLKKSTGVLTYIATNNWVTNAGASKMRNKIINDSKIEKMIDFGSYMIFENADIQTMIMIFRNDSAKDNYQFDYRRLKGSGRTFSDVLDILSIQENEHAEYLTPIIEKAQFLDKTITFSNDSSDNILNKIESKRNFILDELLEVAQGIVAPQDSVNKASQKKLGDDFKIGDGIFVLNTQELNSLNLSEFEKGLIKPFFSTVELNRYYGDSNNNNWVIYTDSSFKQLNSIKPYPKIKKHLDKFLEIITSDNAPYGLHRARKEQFFVGEKIVSLRKCLQPTFTYTNFDCYVAQTFFIIKSTRIDFKYLTGLLNSALVEFWLKNKGKMQGTNYQIDKEPLIEIPIFKASNPQPIVRLIDIILKEKQKDKKAETKDFENQIDALVFNLYGLTTEEVTTVMNSFPALSDTERDRILKYFKRVNDVGYENYEVEA